MTKNEFKTKVLPCKGKIFRLALSLLKSRPEAEDAIQDVYLKLWKMREKLPAYNSVEALAVTVTKNLCIDRLRSYRSRNQNENGLEDYILTGSGPNPAEAAELNENMQQIRTFIGGLPDQQRMVLHLRDIEQYSYDEIEEITGLSRNNIRVTLSRARKQVQKEYLKQQNDGIRKN